MQKSGFFFAVCFFSFIQKLPIILCSLIVLVCGGLHLQSVYFVFFFSFLLYYINIAINVFFLLPLLGYAQVIILFRCNFLAMKWFFRLVSLINWIFRKLLHYKFYTQCVVCFSKSELFVFIFFLTRLHVAIIKIGFKAWVQKRVFVWVL
uniref:(northern house mosquito) hypothetical protein n=1 Tax=Culex pipiens TaxID=7175 RepID=A0A8D8MM66_CULPI